MLRFYFWYKLNKFIFIIKNTMKIKAEYLSKEVYSKILDKMVYVSYENIDLLKNLDLNFIFEEELQAKKK